MIEEKLIPKNIPARRLLGLDYGELFIGVSIFFETLDPFPTPFGRIHARPGMDHVIKELHKMIQDEDINGLVIGIPYLLDGKETSFTKKVQKFGEQLFTAFPHLLISYEDETLSTFAAKKRMEESPRYNFKVNMKEIDALSATIILEDFLKREKSF